MKILNFADLHIDISTYINRPSYNSSQKHEIQDIVNRYNPDMITISGDVVDRYVYFREHNSHCLDIIGGYTKDNVNIIGNVLWYDGSHTIRKDSMNYIHKIYEGWLDATIENFNPMIEKDKCINQIKENILNDKINILITHMCPLYELNGHNFKDASSIFNIYSGYNNLFTDYDIYVDYAICGHTHLPEKAKHIYHDKNKEIYCVNIGNDYFFRTQKTLFNILDV